MTKAILPLPLSVVPDNNPPRHANLLRCPPEKHQQLAIAQQLINAGADVALRPEAATRNR